MVSRRLLVFLLVACLALVIAPSVTVAADSAAKVQLKIYDMPQDDATDAAKQSWERYKGEVEKKFPDVEFVWTRLAPGTDYRQQYDQLLMAGDGPTVTHQFPYVDVQTRLRDGTIAEITDYVNNWDLKKQGLVLDTFDQAISLDGKWYAVPWGPYISGTAVNKAVIAEAGGDPNVVPTTWTEFAESAKALTDKSVPRFGYLLLGSDYNAWTFTPWVWSAGGEMVRSNGDGTWAIAFNEDPGIDAAMFLNQLVNEYQCTQTDVLESYGDMQNHFIAGQAAYGWGAPTWFGKDDLAKYDQTQDSIGFFPMPAKDEGGVNVAFAGGEVWTMSPLATKEQMDAAWGVHPVRVLRSRLPHPRVGVRQLAGPARRSQRLPHRPHREEVFSGHQLAGRLGR